MDSAQEILTPEKLAFVYGPTDILINLAMSFVFGMVISYVYKSTHKGLSYSQSFMLTIVFVTVIVAMVMMVIGNNLARAFALVGALSIIRFRTVVKDTKDTAYVFLALACGMAAGTSSYFLGVAGVMMVSGIAAVLHVTNYGSLYKSEFILSLRVRNDEASKCSEAINEHARTANLLHVEPSGDRLSSKMTYDIVLRKETDPAEFSTRVAEVNGVSEVTLIASKNDVDY